MRRVWMGSILGLMLATPLGAPGQTVPATMPSESPSTQSENQPISLDFPPDLEMKVLIQYVGQRMGINFIYDEQAVNQRITILSPSPISRESLLGLLESALKMKGLIVVDGDQPGWKKIVPMAGVNAVASPTTSPIEASTQPAKAVTQIFVLKNADVQKTDQVIHPFLTPGGGNTVLLPDQRLMIITDYASTIARVAELIHLVDQPPQEIVTQFMSLKNVDVATLEPQIQQIVSAREKAQGGTPNTGTQIELLQDARTNQLILIGPPRKVTEAQEIATSLDVPLPLVTRVYSLKSIAPDRLDRLAKELIDPLDAKRLYQSVADKDSGMLVVTTTAAIQQKIEDLKEQLDVGVMQSASPIRFYKLTNSTAADVLATIRSLEGQEEHGAGGESDQPTTGAAPTISPPPGTNTPPAVPGQSPAIPVYPPSGTASEPPAAISGVSPPSGATPVASAASPITGIHTARGTITADPNTNTIIIEADPAAQQLYEGLIRMLDKRRPQVLIECTLVTLDTSDNYSFGVELGADSAGTPRVITFNSFGLSTPSASTGVLTITPGAGFNGTLLGSQVAQVVVQALQNNGHSRVLSAPKILVNDNATGTLSSVAEQPFTSVNASTTVATTSFAGYATAGTTITLTPHISEGDHLQLEYSVSLNNFTGSSSNGVPPPRQTDSVQSKITIPDGSTAVVGGLNSTNLSESRQTLPFLGDIPLLNLLISQETRSNDRSTLFVFIRPIILRDDQFDDLKFYSQRDAQTAEISGDYPSSDALLIR